MCQSIKLCTGTCHVFPAPTEGVEAASARASSDLKRLGMDVQANPSLCEIPAIKVLCDVRIC